MRTMAICLLAAALLAGCTLMPRPALYVSTPQESKGGTVFCTASASNEDPYAAGRTAALALKGKLGGVAPKAVLVAECFDGESLKKRMLEGIASVFPGEVIFGGATYGTFDQSGCHVADSVSLLGIGGSGIGVEADLRRNLGIAGLTMENDEALIAERLRKAGTELTSRVGSVRGKRESLDPMTGYLLIVIADAHSPKNQYLVEGVQQYWGKEFPITGGSVNKNAGQSFVYYQGRMYQDSAIALMLMGDFKIAMSGRQAKDNAKVIATARDGAAEAMGKIKGKPAAVFAFNCAGRKGKLDNVADELKAMQEALGKDVPLFGCYCAGETGPSDEAGKKPDVLSSGVGWHVMFTVLGK